MDMLFGGPPRRRPEVRAAPPRRVIRKDRARPKMPRAALRKAAPGSAAVSTPKAVAEVPEKSGTAKVVLVVGDFMAGSLAKGLTNAAAQKPDVRVVASIDGSSGLVRDDHYDWPDAIGPLIDGEKPAAVIVMLGSNERQPIEADGETLPLRSDEWNAEYERRAARLAGAVTSKKIPLVWVGMPSFKSDKMNDDMASLNDIYRQAAADAGGEFVDVWDGFVDANGAFTATGPDIDGQPARLRNADGITMTPAGAEKLAFFAEKPIFRLLGTSADAGLPLASSSDGSSKPAAVNATSAPVVALNDPALDGGDELLTGKPPEPRSADRSLDPSPREQLVISGTPTRAVAGRADEFTWKAKGAAVSPARENAAIVSRGSLDLRQNRTGEGMKPPPPMPSLADAIIEDWNSQSAAGKAAAAPGGSASASPSGTPPAAPSEAMPPKPAEEQPAGLH